jgi:predicted DNA-binding protein (UPF0251 family)
MPTPIAAANGPRPDRPPRRALYCLWLHDVEGLRVREVAELLDISTRTVEYRLQAGRKAVRPEVVAALKRLVKAVDEAAGEPAA